MIDSTACSFPNGILERANDRFIGELQWSEENAGERPQPMENAGFPAEPVSAILAPVL